jgi:hypothetical protein
MRRNVTFKKDISKMKEELDWFFFMTDENLLILFICKCKISPHGMKGLQ